MSKQRFLAFVPFLAGVAVVILYSHFLRPIWYDEMVYYAFGGLANPRELAAVLHETTANVHQGQTGAYIFLVFGSLKLFGGSLLALRMVSIAFGILFMVTALLFLRRKGLDWFWQLIFVALIAGASTLMLFVSEARVYIALVGSVTSVLLFYSYAPDERNLRLTCLGWVSVIFLSIVHPYAAIYLPLIIAFSYFAAKNRGQGMHLHGLVRWADPKIVIASALAYISLAALTWLQGTAAFDGDPWEWINQPLLIEMSDHLLMPFVTQDNTLFLWLIVLGTAILYLLSRPLLRPRLASIRPPITLLGTAVIAALLISLLSLFQGFWILPRQWVASIALALIAMTWLLYELWRALQIDSRLLSLSFQLSVFFIALTSVFSLSQFQLNKWIISAQEFPVAIPPEYTRSDLTSRLQREDQLTEKDWIRFAHANSTEGGTVWPEFRAYYLGRDWSDFVVVTDPDELTIYN